MSSTCIHTRVMSSRFSKIPSVHPTTIPIPDKIITKWLFGCNFVMTRFIWVILILEESQGNELIARRLFGYNFLVGRLICVIVIFSRHIFNLYNLKEFTFYVVCFLSIINNCKRLKNIFKVCDRERLLLCVCHFLNSKRLYSKIIICGKFIIFIGF